MNGSLQIGRIFGIPVHLHFTFLLVIPLFAWIIGSQIGLTVELIERFMQYQSTGRSLRPGISPISWGLLLHYLSSSAYSSMSCSLAHRAGKRDQDQFHYPDHLRRCRIYGRDASGSES